MDRLSRKCIATKIFSALGTGAATCPTAEATNSSLSSACRGRISIQALETLEYAEHS